MNEKELQQLLNDPKRILNIVRVFHNVLHKLDEMEELKAKQTEGKKPGVTSMGVSDILEITLRDKDGNIKTQIIEKEVKK